MTSPILVVGGTGTVGRHVVRRLLDAGRSVRVLSRDVPAARTLLGPHVEIVAGNLDDPSSLRAALDDVRVASLATSSLSPALARQEIHFIDAARAAGLSKVVKLSKFGADPDAPDPISRWHAESESRLRGSGLAWVILRPVVFMSNFLFEADAIRGGQLASVFGDGRVSFIDPEDVADLTSTALSMDAADGAIWECGGPRALSYDDVAARFTRVLGHSVEHVRLDETSFRSAAPLPDFVVQALIATSRLARAGRFAADDQLLVRLFGRPGRSLDEWIERHRSAFTR